MASVDPALITSYILARSHVEIRQDLWSVGTQKFENGDYGIVIAVTAHESEMLYEVYVLWS
jgi:hypothetical protein